MKVGKILFLVDLWLGCVFNRLRKNGKIRLDGYDDHHRQNITAWAEQVCADIGRLRPAEGESSKDFGRRLRSASAELRRHARVLIGDVEVFEAREGRLQ